MALGASAWGVGVIVGGKVRGVGAGLGVDSGIVGAGPELLGDMPPEGMRSRWWTKLVLLSSPEPWASGGPSWTRCR
jgi:hypothetical protein